MSRLLHISDKEAEFQAGTIFDIVSRGESGIVVCYPGCKVEYNLRCFLSSSTYKKNYLGSDHRRFLWVIVPLGAHSTLDTVRGRVIEEASGAGIRIDPEQSLVQAVRTIVVSGKELYVLLVENEPVPMQSLTIILESIQSLLMTQDRAGSLLMIERDTHDPNMSSTLASYYKFFQNIRYFPVYSYEESVYFLQTLCEDFGMHMTGELVDEIAQTCGGFLWLMRGVIRKMTDTAAPRVEMEEIYASSMVQMRVGAILAQLTEGQRECMRLIVAEKWSSMPRVELQFLVATGMVQKTGKGYVLTSKLMQQQLREGVRSFDLRVGKNGEVVFQTKRIDGGFSERELSVLRYLLQKRGTIVSRETIAQIAWGSDMDGSYSDWALDKMMSRIRKGLRGEGVLGGLIETKKGSGFLVR